MTLSQDFVRLMRALVLVFLFLAGIFILEKINIILSQKGLFLYARVFQLSRVALITAFFLLNVKWYWRGMKGIHIILKCFSMFFVLVFLAIIYSIAGTVSAHHAIYSSKLTAPAMFLSDQRRVTELTRIARALCAKDNIFWISSKVERGDYFEFGIKEGCSSYAA